MELNNKIIVREITEKDFPVLLSMIQEFASYIGDSEQMKLTIEMLEADKNIFHCFFAENENKEIMGYAFTYFSFHTWSGKTLYLEDIFVKEQYRGLLVGSKFMEILIDFARSNNCNQLNWQVLHTNESAIGFYRKLGTVLSDDKLDCCLKIG